MNNNTPASKPHHAPMPTPTSPPPRHHGVAHEPMKPAPKAPKAKKGY